MVYLCHYVKLAALYISDNNTDVKHTNIKACEKRGSAVIATALKQLSVP